MQSYLNNIFSNVDYYWNNAKAWYQYGSFRYFISFRWKRYGFDLFTNKDRQVTALFDAIHDHDAWLVRTLLNLGVDPNYIAKEEPEFYKSLQGAHPTPLMIAVLWQKGKDDTIIKLLVEKGANPNYKDTKPSRKSSLHKSIISPLGALIFWKKTQLSLIQFFLEHGGNANATIDHNATIRESYLECATRNEEIELAELLLKHKASLKTQNRFGETVLHIAIKQKSHQLLELFMKYKSRINFDIKDDSGDTALHKAVKAKDLQMVKLLISSGANVNPNAVISGSILFSAIDTGNIPLITLLVENGAKMDLFRLNEAIEYDNASTEIRNIIADQEALIQARIAREEREKEEAQIAKDFFNTIVHFARYKPYSLPLSIGIEIAKHCDPGNILSKETRDKVSALASEGHSTIARKCGGKFLKTILEDEPQTSYHEEVMNNIIKSDEPSL
jgi:ankyrin repeat protein